MTEEKKYEFVIEPHKSWFYFDWRGLLHYRDLLLLLVYRDFAAKYKQTILGPLWFILQPLLTTLVFTVIFGKAIRIPTDGLPPTLFYLCALVPWSYFSQCFSETSQALIVNANLFSKVYFPRIIVPLSIVVSNLMTFFIQLATFLAFYVYFKFFTPAGKEIHLTFAIVFLPLLVLQIAALSLGIGLWITALTVKYRDLRHLVGFLAQLWMYFTPVIYPLSAIPSRFRGVLMLNPMTGIVEFFRSAFFGTGLTHQNYLLSSALITLAILVSGIFIFNKVERNFVDTI